MKKIVENLKTTEKFSMTSLMILLLLMLVNLILMIPVSEKVMQISASSMSLSGNQLETMAQIVHKMRYLQIFGMEILYVIMFLFYALLLFLFTRMMNRKLPYKKILQLIVYCYFVVAAGDLVNTTLLYARGLGGITNIHDTSLTGLNLLTSVEQVGATGYTFLGYINPFQLGFLLLLSVGLRILTDVEYLKALIVSVLFWIITILIPVFSVYFSQLTVERAGIM